jgi:hypothetical protein
MTIVTRTFHQSANGDQWRLVRDTETGRVYVRHEGNLPSGGHVSELELGRFLTAGGLGPEHQELLRLIGSLVEDEPDE